MTTHEPLDTVIEALASGDMHLVQVHAQYVIGWLQELRKLRERGDMRPCPDCDGGVRVMKRGEEGTTRVPCLACGGEGVRRADRS